MAMTMSAELIKKATEVFHIFDTDHSMEIDRDEAIRHWKGKFAQIGATELFNTVDTDNDGTINLDEWLEFWIAVKSTGIPDGDIYMELDNIKNGETWVGFNDLPAKYNPHSAKK
eukprot:scaffold63367_cov61-Attheya_sp.AAC.2